MSTIDLTLDNNNELTFQINIEGSSPAKPSCRFLIEGEDMSLAFPGDIERDGIVHVNIPPLEKILKEGSYNSGLEVIVDDRVFVPLTLTTSFEKSVKVTAEAVTRKKRQSVTTSAQLIGTRVRKNSDQTNLSRGLIRETTNQAPKVSAPTQRASEPISQHSSKTTTDKKEVRMNELSENQIRNLVRNMLDSK